MDKSIKQSDSNINDNSNSDDILLCKYFIFRLCKHPLLILLLMEYIILFNHLENIIYTCSQKEFQNRHLYYILCLQVIVGMFFLFPILPLYCYTEVGNIT